MPSDDQHHPAPRSSSARIEGHVDLTSIDAMFATLLERDAQRAADNRDWRESVRGQFADQNVILRELKQDGQNAKKDIEMRVDTNSNDIALLKLALSNFRTKTTAYAVSFSLGMNVLGWLVMAYIESNKGK